MTKVNMKPMQEFVQEVARPKSIGELLDEVLFEYACGKIERSEQGIEQEIINKLQTLRELRNVFNAM